MKLLEDGTNTLLQLWRNVVLNHGDAPALRSLEESGITELSFEELDRLSDRLAIFMRAQGVMPRDKIVIASTKCDQDYALMLACLKSGVVYAHLDIANPIARSDLILQTCAPRAVFGSGIDNALVELVAKHGIDYHDYSLIDTASPDDSFKPANIDGNDLAYIMFTSGSTGVPKGVAITHANLLPFISWVRQRYAVQPGKDVFAQLSPLYFDNSVFDFYGGLLNGAALAPVRRADLADPRRVLEVVNACACTIWFSVPSLLIYLMRVRALNGDSLLAIRLFTFGGEGYPKSELKKLFDLFSSHAEFINVYGPTEGTCICSSYTVSPSDFNDLSDLPPLGPINSEFEYVILDGDGVQLSGQPGELCILGPQISPGYYNNPDLTARAFLTYEHKTKGPLPAYRTGDVVVEDDGVLHFRGRTDNQIKHMGHRIELEEIEAAINSLPQIQQACVVYRRDSQAAYGKITAYYLSEKGHAYSEREMSELKIGLEEKIPSYMMPHVYQRLETFPKNANGKIDRSALAALEV